MLKYECTDILQLHKYFDGLSIVLDYKYKHFCFLNVKHNMIINQHFQTHNLS